MKPLYYLGGMTGTSLDAADVALLAFHTGPDGLETGQPWVQALVSVPYPDDLRSLVLAAAQGQARTMEQWVEMDVRIARLYVQACQQLLNEQGLQSSDIMALGAHGQTVHHQPRALGPHAIRSTVQLGDPNIMAVALNLPVVADMRRRDMALGGQGAPLACAFHQAVFGHAHRTRVVLNLGGIANITVLPPGTALSSPVLGYDTGPANMLLDAWITQHTTHVFDRDGAWARSGTLITPWLETLLADPYFAQPAPKSTGREYFGLSWLQRHLQNLAATTPFAPQDVQRTLLELTCKSVANAIAQHATEDAAGDVLVCGGGAYNRFMLQRLQALLPAWGVQTTDQHGIPAQAVEAAAFAYFAHKTIRGMPFNMPSVTGASRPCLLGAVYYP